MISDHNKNSGLSEHRGSLHTFEKSLVAPFTFDYLENQMRTKTFGILGTISDVTRLSAIVLKICNKI